MEQTEYSETSAYKFQTPVITQKKHTTFVHFLNNLMPNIVKQWDLSLNEERSEDAVNPLKPNDLKKRRTAHLSSRYCILYIYSTNIRTEYFKHAA